MDAYTTEITTLRNASSRTVYGQWSLEPPGSGDLVPRELFFAGPPALDGQDGLTDFVRRRFLEGHATRVLDLAAGTQVRLDDLNGRAKLPFADGEFDTVLCGPEVGTLARPIEVFREVSRVLAPGGLFLVTYGPAFYAKRFTRMWALGDDFDHITLVESFFSFSEAFTRNRTLTAFRTGTETDWVLGGLPPEESAGVYLYATWAYRERVSPRHEAHPPFAERPRIADAGRADVRLVEGGRPVCPHCQTLMEPIAPPVTPFEIDYGVERLYVCFDDGCTYHMGSRSWMRRQGRPNMTYRFSYNPDNGAVGPILDNLFQGLASSRIDG